VDRGGGSLREKTSGASLNPNHLGVEIFSTPEDGRLLTKLASIHQRT